MLRLVVLALLLACPPFAQADERLWAALAGGGHAVFIRHAVTTPGVGDPPGFKLGDCATQRNLTDEGRAHARRIGAAWRERKVPTERLLSSPWCRCLETAELAFGSKPVAWTPLSNLFGRGESSARQVREMRALLAQKTKDNVVLVTHGSTIAALSGINPGTGEMVIFSTGPEPKLVGRLRVD